MLVSKKLLNMFVDIKDKSVEELSDALTSLGLEVEGNTSLAAGDGIVIAKVLSREKHPDSEKLGLCKVEYGEGEVQVVCGAQNVAAGQHVIFAKLGAVLPGDFKIKPTQIRGVDSNGMICSLSELGVDKKVQSEASLAGIEVLGSDAPVGGNPLEYLGLDDEIIEIGLTPNRADCYSAVQVAKELAVYFGLELKVNTAPEVKLTESKGMIKADKCSAFTLTSIDGVENGESCNVTKSILMALGINSISKIVDGANMETQITGQPMHIYDADKISALTVQDDVEGKMVGIDDIEYDVVKGDVVIMDGSKIAGIAGIMGAKYCSVTMETKNIVIEVANFNHVAIRKTANRLQLFTQAATRYMKGRDSGQIKTAINQIVNGLKATVKSSTYEGKLDIENTVIELDFDKVNSYLGTSIENSKMESILTSLGFTVNGSKVTVPTIRQDVTLDVDLIEEIGRVYGYNNIEAKFTSTSTTASTKLPSRILETKIRRELVGYGLNETITYQLTNEKTATQFNMLNGEVVKLALPMSSDRAVLRQSIVPQLLEVIKNNQARGQKDVSIFEISKVYEKENFQNNLAIAMTGKDIDLKWEDVSKNVDFYSLKAIIISLMARLGYQEGRYFINKITREDASYHPGMAAEIVMGKDVIGYFGKIHPKMDKKYKLANVFAGEINLSILEKQRTGIAKAKPVNQYQAVTNDFTFDVEENVEAKSLVNSIRKGAKKLATNIEVVSIFRGESIGEGLKSVSFRVILEDNKKTLTNEELEATRASIIKEVLSTGAKMR